MVNEEPVRERDKVMLGMLASIGIERGKTFEPDAKHAKDAGRGARRCAPDHAEVLQTPGKALSRPGGQQSMVGLLAEDYGLANEFTYETDDGAVAGPRAGGLFYWATFVPKKLGAGTFYLMGLSDSAGQLFDGRATYRLRVPAEVPARDFWSAIVYDMETKAFVCAGPCDAADNGVGLSSFNKP